MDEKLRCPIFSQHIELLPGSLIPRIPLQKHSVNIRGVQERQFRHGFFCRFFGYTKNLLKRQENVFIAHRPFPYH